MGCYNHDVISQMDLGITVRDNDLIFPDNTGDQAVFLGAQLLQSQFNGIAVVEIGVLLTGMDIQLLCLCLINGSSTSGAVAVIERAGSNGAGI